MPLIIHKNRSPPPPSFSLSGILRLTCKKWANYLDLHLEFDEDGKLFTRLYDKRDDFDFPIVNCPCLSSNIPESPAYGVFVSQLCSGLTTSEKGGPKDLKCISGQFEIGGLEDLNRVINVNCQAWVLSC